MFLVVGVLFASAIWFFRPKAAVAWTSEPTEFLGARLGSPIGVSMHQCPPELKPPFPCFADPGIIELGDNVTSLGLVRTQVTDGKVVRVYATVSANASALAVRDLKEKFGVPQMDALPTSAQWIGTKVTISYLAPRGDNPGLVQASLNRSGSELSPHQNPF
jgi:hypothetical protein